jgi:hypothetical protein
MKDQIIFSNFQKKSKLSNGTWSYLIQFNPVPTKKFLKKLVGQEISFDGEDWEVLEYFQSITFPYSMVTLNLKRLS